MQPRWYSSAPASEKDTRLGVRRVRRYTELEKRMSRAAEAAVAAASYGLRLMIHGAWTLLFLALHCVGVIFGIFAGIVCIGHRMGHDVDVLTKDMNWEFGNWLAA